MNSLFASNFICSIQIFALSLFLDIHTEFALRGFSSTKKLVLFYCTCLHDYLVFVNAIVLEKAKSVYSYQNYLPLTLFNWTRFTSIVDF